MARTGLFVYGFIRASEDRSTGIMGIENDGVPAEVRVIVTDGVGAVVSDAAGGERPIPSRKHLGSHSRVIQAFLASIIPMSFGQVVKSAAELKKFIKKNRTALLAELEWLDGKVEMSLRVRWDVENIFEYFVDGDPELAEARDRVFGIEGQPSHADKLGLGGMFEALLTAERTKCTDQVVELMRPSTSDVKVNTPKNEKMVMDLVMLVERDGVGNFERRVHEVADTFPSQYTFEFTGPWAPFSFVELDLQPRA